VLVEAADEPLKQRAASLERIQGSAAGRYCARRRCWVEAPLADRQRLVKL